MLKLLDHLFKILINQTFSLHLAILLYQVRINKWHRLNNSSNFTKIRCRNNKLSNKFSTRNLYSNNLIILKVNKIMEITCKEDFNKMSLLIHPVIESIRVTKSWRDTLN